MKPRDIYFVALALLTAATLNGAGLTEALVVVGFGLAGYAAARAISEQLD